MPRRKPAMSGMQGIYAPPKAHVAIGLIHLVLGVISAIGVVAFFFQPFVAGGYLLMTAYLASIAALRIFGGLWLADGKRRGARLALAGDILQLIGLVVTFRTATIVGLLESVALTAGVLWVMPHLELGEDSAERTRRHTRA